MAATPFPTDFVYAGAAQKLTLKTPVVDGGGDLTLSVNEDTAAAGWPVSLSVGQRLVIVVGRGTAFETKYAVKSITAGAGGSTLVVDAADKTWDSTPVTAAPAGTFVEHCLSASEMNYLNDHARTRQAHGSDGDLVDQNSAQALSNKTFPTPTAASHPATKAYVEAGFIPRLTQAQIDALSGDSRPIGLTVSNATTGQFQKWDGTKWVDYVDSSGSFTGDLSLVQNGAGDKGIRFLDGAVRRWYVAFEQATKRLNVHRYNSSGTYQGAPIIIEENGRVISGSHVGDVWVGTADGSGRVTIPLPTSPTGRWSVIASVVGEGDLTVMSQSGPATTSVTYYIWFSYDSGFSWQRKTGGVTVNWHAIAY